MIIKNDTKNEDKPNQFNEFICISVLFTQIKIYSLTLIR
jgi:hypothetical protein